MVGLPFDCLANPLGAVRLTFDKALSSGFDASASAGKDWGAVDLFYHFLFDNGGLSQVPILNAASVKYIQPNTLVRFRGMIQDMLGNEFYVGAYKDGATWRTSKFSDVCPLQVDLDLSPDVKLWERRLLYCVPVPGLNSWTESFETTTNLSRSSTSEYREKRPREDDEGADHMELVSDQEHQGSPNSKRMREDGHQFLSALPRESLNNGNGPGISSLSGSEGNSLPCLVKVYDSAEADLKINEVFEFIGVLGFDLESTIDNSACDELSNALSEDELVHLPPGKVPRLHCLVHRKLAVHDFLPSSPFIQPNPSLIGGLRDGLLRHFTSLLGNDGVAAHYLLLHLLSRVHARAANVAVGKLSLNFTGFSNEAASVFGSRLQLAVNSLLPFTRCMPLTLEYLNSTSLVPKKDYQANRLMYGELQLAEGSHLTIDETRLQAGTLNSTGVENARSLKNLAELQKVEYDFQFYKMEMAADVQLLVLSEGKSNIVPADLVIPFHPSSMGSSDIIDEATLQSWRWYLATQRQLSHSISPGMQKVVENDLVAARQADRSLGCEDFSRLLSLGRLASVSYGEMWLTMEHWQMVKELERLRRERLKLNI